MRIRPSGQEAISGGGPDGIVEDRQTASPRLQDRRFTTRQSKRSQMGNSPKGTGSGNEKLSTPNHLIRAVTGSVPSDPQHGPIQPAPLQHAGHDMGVMVLDRSPRQATAPPPSAS